MNAGHAPDPREDVEQHDGQREERIRPEQDVRTARATIGLGALLVVLAVAVLVQAVQLPSGRNNVGPATLLWVIGPLLFVVGGMTIRTAYRDLGGRDPGGRDPGGRDPGGRWRSGDGTRQDWARMLALLVLLMVFAVALGWLGYVVSATFLFGASAIVLGARRRLRSFAYGWVIAVVVQLVFDVGIGLSLPDGPWGF